MINRTGPSANDDQSEGFRALIDSIRDEAIEAADKRASDLLAEAELRAARIVAQAQREADEFTNRARLAAEQFEAAGRDAVLRACRDTLLSLEQAIGELLDAVVLRETQTALSGDGFMPLLQELLGKWQPEESGAGIELLLNSEQLRHLEETCWQTLQVELRKGVVLKPVENADAGLRIGERDGHVHYDFTAATLAKWMTRYLKPRLADILKEALAGISDNETGAPEKDHKPPIIDSK